MRRKDRVLLQFLLFGAVLGLIGGTGMLFLPDSHGQTFWLRMSASTWPLKLILLPGYVLLSVLIGALCGMVGLALTGTSMIMQMDVEDEFARQVDSLENARTRLHQLQHEPDRQHTGVAESLLKAEKAIIRADAARGLRQHSEMKQAVEEAWLELEIAVRY